MKLERIKAIVDELNSPDKLASLMTDRQLRLKRLADKHGVEAVALASGLAVSSLSQYLRIKNPLRLNLGEQAVAQAEYVFKQL